MIKQAIGRIKTATKTVTGIHYDMLDLLRSDHMKVESMLIQLRIIRDGNHRSKLLRQIRSELDKHMRIEEEIFYPACMDVTKLRGLVEHSYDEHQEVRDQLKQLSKLDPSNQRFSKMVTDIIMNIEHHVKDEEDKLFPGVRKNMDEREFNRVSREVLRAHSGAMPASARARTGTRGTKAA